MYRFSSIPTLVLIGALGVSASTAQAQNESRRFPGKKESERQSDSRRKPSEKSDEKRESSRTFPGSRSRSEESRRDDSPRTFAERDQRSQGRIQTTREVEPIVLRAPEFPSSRMASALRAFPGLQREETIRDAAGFPGMNRRRDSDATESFPGIDGPRSNCQHDRQNCNACNPFGYYAPFGYGFSMNPYGPGWNGYGDPYYYLPPVRAVDAPRSFPEEVLSVNDAELLGASDSELSKSLRAALNDLSSFWEEHDRRALRRHISPQIPIAVYDNNRILYKKSANDFLLLASDAIDRAQTVSFRFDRMQRTTDGFVTAYAVHRYRPRSENGVGPILTGAVRCDLVLRNGEWFLSAIRLSSDLIAK